MDDHRRFAYCDQEGWSDLGKHLLNNKMYRRIAEYF